MSEGKAAIGYFHSLSVQDLRCFGPLQTLELHDRDGRLSKWTVILGDNGVGKTTLLQCLYAMSPISSTSSGPRPVVENSVSRSTSWRSWPGRTKASPFEALSRGSVGPLAGVRIVSDVLFGELPSRVGLLAEQWFADGARSGSAQGTHKTEMFICGFGAGRKPGTAELAGDIDTENAATLFDDQAALLNAEKWFLDFDYAASRTGTEAARDRADRIRKTLIDLLPDIDELRVVGLDLDPPRPALEVHTPYGWVRITELSLGYRTLMTWVLDFVARLFARYPKSANPLAEPAVCLVDEIDLHLHPAWQRKLISYLDQHFPKTQFIVTAHSPLVVQAAESLNVAVLRRHDGDDHVTIHNDLTAVEGWRVDQILTSDLFGLEGSRSPRFNELLRERANLLSQASMDEAASARVAEIDRQLAVVPHGDTAKDQDAWRLLREFAGRIDKQASGS